MGKALSQLLLTDFFTRIYFEHKEGDLWICPWLLDFSWMNSLALYFSTVNWVVYPVNGKM